MSPYQWDRGVTVGKVVDHMTWGSCIPIDSVKSRDDYSNFVHNIGIRACVELDKINLVHLVG